MNKEELIKKLNKLLDEDYSSDALFNNGYMYGVRDAIDIVKNLNLPVVSKRFCLLTDGKPQKAGEVEIITSRGRIIKAKYDTLCGNDVWEVGYDLHKINESVVAWR